MKLDRVREYSGVGGWGWISLKGISLTIDGRDNKTNACNPLKYLLSNPAIEFQA